MRNHIYLYLSAKITLVIILFTYVLTTCSANQQINTIITPAPTNTKAPSGNVQLQNNGCINAQSPKQKNTSASLFPLPKENENILGKSSAFVTIITYIDYQCSSCAKLNTILHDIVLKYPNDIRVIFRHFPLISIHEKATLAAQAVEAAKMQDSYLPMHNLLFDQQSQWLAMNIPDFEAWLINEAALIGLDKTKFSKDLVSEKNKNLIYQKWEDGQKIKLPGVPIILINGELIKWQPDLLNQLENIIMLTYLQKYQYQTCPPIVIEPQKDYTAVLNTSRGIVKIHLFSEKAPNTVNNFIFLAKNNWYDNNKFFNIKPDSMVQTGDPSGTGFGNPGYYIPHEETGFIFDRAGIVGMIGEGIDLNGSQFIITLTPMPQLNKQYQVFGEVVSGMEVLYKIASLENDEKSIIILRSVTIEEK